MKTKFSTYAWTSKRTFSCDRCGKLQEYRLQIPYNYLANEFSFQLPVPIGKPFLCKACIRELVEWFYEN